jgi:SAM-dependent methyltransferase
MEGSRRIEEVWAGPCPVCAADERSPVASGYDYEYGTCSNTWTIVRCTCGHMMLDPRPSDSTLATIYPPHYYSYEMRRSVNPIALRCKEWLDRRKLESIFRFAGRTPSTYLDVGCGDGRFLESAADLGVDRAGIHGVELDERAVLAANELGLNVKMCRVEEADHIPADSLDLATMFHVIEHVSDPRAVIRSLYGKIRPGGLFVLETPNTDSWDARLFRDGSWGGYHIPRHWHFFDRGTMSRLLTEEGFDVQAVRYQTGHSFWLFSFHHVLKYGWRWPVFANMFHPLKSLPALAAVVALDMIRSKLGFKTSAMLVIARKPEA